MGRYLFVTMIVGLTLLLVGLPFASAPAGEAEKREPAPAEEEKKAGAPAETKAAPEKPAVEKPTGLVGTIIAVNPASQTLVVDIPLGKEVLRVGAEVTGKTKITAGGKPVSLDRLKAGDRVRINFRRVATGDEAISVEVLPGAKS